MNHQTSESWLGLAVLGVLIFSVGMPASADYRVEHYSPGIYYQALVLADMDYDGVPEVLAGRRYPNPDRVEIWKYNPGTQALEIIDAITGFLGDIHDIAAADLDYDGDMDLAVTLEGVGLYLAKNKSGSWSLARIDARSGLEVHIADFDQDGDLDIFHGTRYSYARVLYNDGIGHFALGPSPPIGFTSYNAAQQFTPIDLNGDSRIDLVGLPSERYGYAPIHTYLRAFLNLDTPRGIAWSFPLGPVDPFPNGCFGAPNLAADLDRDGHVDQVAPMEDGQIQVFWGDVLGSDLVWHPDTLDFLRRSPSSGAITDLNDDGILDILISGGGYFSGLVAYEGDGNGRFDSYTIHLDYGVGEGRNGLKCGDVSGDFCTDVVANKGTDGFVALFKIALYVVQIDIKPGSYPNSINNNGYGVIPVAILGGADFDVKEIDPATVKLESLDVKAVGKTHKLLARVEDVNNDGYEDLVVQIEKSDVTFLLGSDTATLTANLYDGTPIGGSDTINIVP